MQDEVNLKDNISIATINEQNSQNRALLPKPDYSVLQTGPFSFCRQTLGYEYDQISQGNLEILHWIVQGYV
jgi:hypothetical protein